MAGQASLAQRLVPPTFMATLMQRRYGPGGVGALVAVGVVASVVVGEDGDLMDTPGDRF